MNRKRLLIAGLVLALAFAFTACGNSKTGNVSDLPEVDTGDLMEFPVNGEEIDSDDEFAIYGDDEDYEDDEEPIVHDGPFVPSSYDGTIYKSKLKKLGEYKGITYSYDPNRVPTDQEVRDEMMATIEMYDETELSEKVVTEVLGYDSMKEFESETKEELTDTLREEEYTNACEKLLLSVIEKSEFEIDDSEVDAMTQETLDYYESMAGYFGVTFEELVTDYFCETMDELKAETRNESLNTIKGVLITEAIIKAEKIDVKALWDNTVSSILDEYGYEDAWEYVDDCEDELPLIDEVRKKIIISFLMENGNKQ